MKGINAVQKKTNISKDIFLILSRIYRNAIGE